MDISNPPSLNFTRKDTPIIVSNDLNARFKEYNIWLKRDDLTGMELSGNKVRKLDFLLKDAMIKGANFRKANLRGADLSGADLSFAILTDADITNIKLDGANLANAIWIDGLPCALNSVGACLR